ncbi:MAG: hypothetical protein JW786_09010 [Desulfobacterales bacterium]|nr:hypothetical protein [Desulfobacterales bacterium]
MNLKKWKNKIKWVAIHCQGMLRKIRPKPEANAQGYYLTQKKTYIVYIEKLRDIFLQSVFLLCFTTALTAVFFYLSKMLWYLYITVPVGQRYVEMYAEKAQIIGDIFNRNLLSFACEITLSAFKICLAIGAFSQFFHLTRFFYLPGGFLYKIILWGLPLTATVAMHLQYLYEFEQFNLLYGLSIIPTLCVFTQCFEFTYELLPEAGHLISQALYTAKNIIPLKFSALKKQMKNLIDKINAS